MFRINNCFIELASKITFTNPFGFDILTSIPRRMTWRSQQDFQKTRAISAEFGRKPQPNHHWSGRNDQQYSKWQYLRRTGLK